MSFETTSIRNVAVVGHGGTGKTTLVEHILAAAKVIPRPETVESGKTVSDCSEEEIERKISVRTSLVHLPWQDTKINILDTPGSSDFVGEVAAAMQVAESALVVVGADAGVQIETIKTWRRLSKTAKPTMVFLNKVEKEHAQFDGVLDDMRQRFEGNFVPLTIPIETGPAFKGIIDVLAQKAYIDGQATDIPDELSETAEEARMALAEAAADGNDELMEKYLEEESLTDDEVKKGLSLALAAGKCIPVFAGVALADAGVAPLLDFIAASAPAPGGEVVGNTSTGQTTRNVSSSEPVACFAFKTSIDQFSGKLSYVKVCSGRLTPGLDLLNYRDSSKERLSKIYTCNGKTLEEVDTIEAGDLGVLVKLDSMATGDTLGDAAAPIQLPELQLPQPVHSVAVWAESKKDEDKLGQSIHRMLEEDPTLRLLYNRETRENVLSTMGELQLSIVLGAIKDKQKIDVKTKVPKVAYRETITKPATAEYQHKKQTGGHGQYARVSLEIKPIERGKEFEFVNAIFGGAISKGYIPGVEKGVREGMEQGILASYPVVDLEAKVVDGKEHPVDSSEMSFKLAARGALRDAMGKASPVLLEPVMNLEVMVEDQYLGDVLSDLSSRRGRVLGQEPFGGGIQLVKAQVPQAELLRYSIDLKSMTSGTASFEMSFDHYDPISGKVADDVIKSAQTDNEEG
jgi:elongation factor G